MTDMRLKTKYRITSEQALQFQPGFSFMNLFSGQAISQSGNASSVHP
jgi:hypothetical protein